MSKTAAALDSLGESIVGVLHFAFWLAIVAGVLIGVHYLSAAHK